MLKVNPYLTFPGNCRQAIEFYRSALDADTVFLQTVGESPMSDMGPAGNIMHCTLRIGDSMLMLSDDPRPDAPAAGGNISLAIGLHEAGRAQQLFANLSAGGAVIMPLTKTYWAEAFGMLTDRFGVRWMINCDAPH